VYVAIAKKRGWPVRYVFETHVHADHLSRARELAKQTDATLLLPLQQRVKFPFQTIADGDCVSLGSASITAMHTPGHTNESTSYVLNQAAVFTGDTLFTNGVGRPDLHADPEAARQRARALFVSLTHLQQLRPEIVVLPAHASEPIAFDGQPVAARLGDVTTWLWGWMASESAFVECVTSNLPATPPNFARIVHLNEAGEFPTGDPTELEAGANRCAVR
jgi:glyoxylase-like metal-dependent hydrolase (beta-lactamase superfamily II)